MNIVFMGTPDFAVPSLEALIKADYKPVLVVTRPDLPRGRGQKVDITPVKACATAHGIPLLQPESVKDPEFIAALAAIEIDVMAVVAYRILPEAVYGLAKKGAFNLHGSLLPAFRGAAPIHRAVMAGEQETGVTTFFLRKQVDTGDVILRAKTPIGPNETTGDVYERLMHLGADLVVETVKLIAHGAVETQKQDDALASPAPKIFPEACFVNWETSAQEVHNFIRGLSPFPGARSTLQSKLFKVYRSELSDLEKPRLPSGTLFTEDGKLLVACGQGTISLVEVQLEGRKRLSAEAFLAGNMGIIGERFDPIIKQL